MRQRWFYLAYFASPLLPVAIYALRFRSFGNVYFLSICLGLFAYTYLCNQLILVSRPRFAVKALGEKKLEALHSNMPVLILFLAALHRFLKVGSIAFTTSDQVPSGFFPSLVHCLQLGLGFRTGTTQTGFGAGGWWLLCVITLFSAVFLSARASRSGSALHRIRAAADKRGLGPGRARRVHILALLVGLLLMAHVLLASSTSLTTNPVAAIWLLAYLVGCAVFYAVEKIRAEAHQGPEGRGLFHRFRTGLGPGKDKITS
jgi:hypothetical protein